jgi:hypothetical protein
MAAHLRMDGHNLQTVIRCCTHPDSDRRVWLAATVHHGRPGYHAGVRAAVDQLRVAGVVVHCESTALHETLPDPPADLTSEEHRLLRLQAEQDRLANTVAIADGWVDQATGFGARIPDGWQRVDLTILDIIRLAGTEVIGRSLRVGVAELERACASPRYRRRHNRVAAFVLRLAAAETRLPAKPTDAVVVDRRTQVALDGVEVTDDDLVLVWSAAHMPGLAAGLLERGFIPDPHGEQWHTVGRLPAMMRLLPSVVWGIAGRLRQARALTRQDHDRQDGQAGHHLDQPPATAPQAEQSPADQPRGGSTS